MKSSALAAAMGMLADMSCPIDLATNATCANVLHAAGGFDRNSPYEPPVDLPWVEASRPCQETAMAGSPHNVKLAAHRTVVQAHQHRRRIFCILSYLDAWIITIAICVHSSRRVA